MSQPSRPRTRGDRPRLAIVLSGGGARGAYEAGVLKYIREDLAGDLGGQVHFDIICGTSVGAIHACFLAATADKPKTQGRALVERWESLVLEEVVSFGWRELLKARKTLLGSGDIEELAPGERRLGGIVQTQNLERMVGRMVPWSRIRKNKEQKHFDSLAISATDIGSGKTVVFVESREPLPPWSVHPYVRAQAVKMGPQHCMASAALPVLFPAVQVGERFYCDGGLRQNTPLSPALRLGADKVLVISLRYDPPTPTDALPEESQAYPGAAFLAGKILNAFLLDHVEYDLMRMQRLSDIMEAVNSSGDTTLIARVNAAVTGHRGAPYRVIKDLVIAPSINLGAIAGEMSRANKFKGTGGGRGIRMLRRFATGGSAGDADLLSYIFFDGIFATELVRIGYEDARAQHDDLARFLSDCVDRE